MKIYRVRVSWSTFKSSTRDEIFFAEKIINAGIIIVCHGLDVMY